MFQRLYIKTQGGLNLVNIFSDESLQNRCFPCIVQSSSKNEQIQKWRRSVSYIDYSINRRISFSFCFIFFNIVNNPISATAPIASNFASLTRVTFMSRAVVDHVNGRMNVEGDGQIRLFDVSEPQAPDGYTIYKVTLRVSRHVNRFRVCVSKLRMVSP